MGQALLVNSPPQIVLLAVDLHKDFIDVEGVAVASVLAFQPAGINGSEFDAPEADRFAADGDTSLSEKVFYVTVAEVEAVIKPDSVTDDVWRALQIGGAYR